MRLFVCWTRRTAPGYPHACNKAYEALKAAGHEFDVVHALSFGGIPGPLQTPARKEVKEHTGHYWVPALETGDGEWISGSKEIIAWAGQHAP